jgi:hypothetical protein
MTLHEGVRFVFPALAGFVRASTTGEAFPRQPYRHAGQTRHWSNAPTRCITEYHQQVIDALDKTLIPGATNEELKALLVKVRPAFVAHLERASQLQSSLNT